MTSIINDYESIAKSLRQLQGEAETKVRDAKSTGWKPEEGGPCGHRGCDGTLEIALPGPCTCGNIAPCIHCENAFLCCETCGFEPSTLDED